LMLMANRILQNQILNKSNNKSSQDY